MRFKIEEQARKYGHDLANRWWAVRQWRAVQADETENKKEPNEMTYYELTPAYVRDYRNKAEVTKACHAGKDFIGDYQLGFQVVNREDIPKPCTVNLRYRGQRSLAVVKVTE